MKKADTLRLTLAALFVALGLVLPFLTGQIPEIGSMLLPMHLPALLCGFVCGWPCGLAVGFVMPLLRSLIFGMPPLSWGPMERWLVFCTKGCQRSRPVCLCL